MQESVTIELWMLNYIDEHKGELIIYCKSCSDKLGFKRYISMRSSPRSLDQFNKRHKWCGHDREFNIRWLELHSQTLDDKQKLFIHQCMDEGIERDKILELINKKRQKMPAQAF